MMPGMDGIEVLQHIKATPKLAALPVIMQTARAAKDDIREGLEAGAYYYLTKPFDAGDLLAIVRTSVSDFERYKELQSQVEQTNSVMSHLDEGQFTFRTLEEATNLIPQLANACPDASAAALGLSELTINAIEHGNLGISYEEKSLLQKEDIWMEEIANRLADPEHAGKFVTLTFKRTDSDLTFTIRDQGNGFDWQDYLTMEAARAFDSHGRGICMANALSFDELEYRGCGNEVVARIKLDRGEE